MRLSERIMAHVGTTTLNPNLVKEFLQTSPHYHQWGVLHQLNQAALNRLKTTDLFEFYVRQYLLGRHKTLQAVLREVRTFTNDDPIGAACCIAYSLAGLRHQLLDLEWYELLPRLDRAQEQIATLTLPMTWPVQPVIANLFHKFD